MNAAEHITEAERLLRESAGTSEYGDGVDSGYMPDLVAAQAHATLALALIQNAALTPPSTPAIKVVINGKELAYAYDHASQSTKRTT